MFRRVVRNCGFISNSFRQTFGNRNFHLSYRVNSEIRRPLILGIETSCDDTGSALVDAAGTIHGESNYSQERIHLNFGGIIPPIAQEFHRQKIEQVVADTFEQSNISIDDIDAIAVTNRPGLILSLLVGIRYAKHLARKHSKPLISIHHMEAHALTSRLNNDIEYPFLCLLASGGHCLLTLVKNVNEFHLLGESIDDAPGECFDKTARLIQLQNLPEYKYCNGGKAIELAAKKSLNPDKFPFPLPLKHEKNCQFSFSGFKSTAMSYKRKIERELELEPDAVIPDYEDFCAGYLKGITKHMLHRSQRAIEYCEKMNLLGANVKKSFVFSGGVACNDFIFTALQQLCSEYGYECYRPAKKHCTDNGVMIAWNGVERWNFEKNEYLNLDIDEILPQPKCPFGNNLIKNVELANIGCDWVKVPIMKIENKI